MEDRESYSEIKLSIFESLYTAFRGYSYNDSWSYDDILAYQYDQWYYRGESYEGELTSGLGSFAYPVEYLMLEVIFLTLAGNLSPKLKSQHLLGISNILKFHSLESMTSSVPVDEREEFHADLKELGILNQQGDITIE